MSVYFDTTRKVFHLKSDKTGFLDFWMCPHTWEMILNVYIRTRDSSYLKLLKDTYTAFLRYNWCGSTWSNNRMMRFIIEGNQRQYLDWMNKNGESVWKNRRPADNIMWNHWTAAAPDTIIEAQAATGGACLLQLLAIANAQQGIVMQPRGKAYRTATPSRGPRFFSLNGRVMKGRATGATTMQVKKGIKMPLLKE